MSSTGGKVLIYIAMTTGVGLGLLLTRYLAVDEDGIAAGNLWNTYLRKGLSLLLIVAGLLSHWALLKNRKTTHQLCIIPYVMAILGSLGLAFAGYHSGELLACLAIFVASSLGIIGHLMQANRAPQHPVNTGRGRGRGREEDPSAQMSRTEQKYLMRKGRKEKSEKD